MRLSCSFQFAILCRIGAIILFSHSKGNRITGSSARGRNKWNSPKYSHRKYRQEITRYPFFAALAVPAASSSGTHCDHVGPLSFPYYCQYSSSASSQVVGNKTCVLPLFNILMWDSLQKEANWSMIRPTRISRR